MIRLILNDEHLGAALGQALDLVRHRLFIATADVKDVHLAAPGCGLAPKTDTVPFPQRRKRVQSPFSSIVKVFESLSARPVEVCLLHSGVPSGPFLAELKRHVPPNLTMRRCPRVHAKAVIADSKWMYLGSANLTGAGLGAKNRRRRNFETGIWTDELPLIDGVLDMLQSIWNGSQCAGCGRKDYCPQPLEEPAL